MTEEIKKPEDTQAATQNQQQTAVTPVTQTESSPDIKSESNKENWRKFREEREQERKARTEAEKIAVQKQQEAEALKAAMESILNKPQHQQYQQPEFNQDNDQDMIEKKIQEALNKERIRYQQEQEQQERQSLPSKLESTYRDFNHVCSTENLDYFEYHYPEIAKAYRHMPEGFDKWSSIYQSVKRFVPQGHKEDQQRMQENASKPKSVTPSMLDTKPQTAGWKLTEERKKENWERMQRDRKSFG